MSNSNLRYIVASLFVILHHAYKFLYNVYFVILATCFDKYSTPD